MDKRTLEVAERRSIDHGRTLVRLANGTEIELPERRTLTADTEFRATDDGEMRIQGHAAVFDLPSENLGGFVEYVARGAFKKSLGRQDDVRALWNHDENFVLGRTKSNTLELSEDPRGLRCWIEVADTTYARDLKVLMERGDVDQMSFAFTTSRDQWEELEDGSIVRTIKEIDTLYDVSVVTYPAYPQTDAKVRKLTAEAGGDPEELPEELASATETEADEGREARLRELQFGAHRSLTLARIKNLI